MDIGLKRLSEKIRQYESSHSASCAEQNTHDIVNKHIVYHPAGFLTLVLIRWLQSCCSVQACHWLPTHWWSGPWLSVGVGKVVIG